jgi:RNA polymerase sigma factor
MNDLVKAAVSDEQARENFIRDNEQTILRIASGVSGRYITRSDDEWSVALLAFNKAIDTYEETRGSFQAYAGVVIKRALTDNYRSEKKYSQEVPVSHEMLTGEGEYEENSEVLRAVSRDSTQEQERLEESRSLKDEIIEVNERLRKYGFSFSDLKDCSPKAGKTKRECARAITYVIDNEEALKTVIIDGRIPIKEIEKKARINKKLLDRYRRYIIMAVVILSGEYPLLADYLQYVRKEGAG